MTPENLRAVRQALGLSQTALAKALGVTQNTISRWELGEMEIANPVILRLALDRLISMQQPLPPGKLVRIRDGRQIRYKIEPLT